MKIARNEAALALMARMEAGTDLTVFFWGCSKHKKHR